MCGIIGIIAAGPVTARLIEGLRRLEYRGYDSAGVATLCDGRIEVRRASGKLDNLATRLAAAPAAGSIGIGHTRWATHGAPTEVNAHPHATSRVAVVHNGIIDNFRELRAELVEQGCAFASQTDTEVIPRLIGRYLEFGLNPVDAVATALKRLEGTFALVALFAGEEDLLVAARRGSPLAIGIGEREMFVASDTITLAPLTRRIVYLQEGDWAEMRRGRLLIRDGSDRIVARPTIETKIDVGTSNKGDHRHFMQKEIRQQPFVLDDTIRGCLGVTLQQVGLSSLPFPLDRLRRLTIVACGSSYYAGLVAKHWLEKFAGLSVELDIASEFRYRTGPLPADGGSLFISQSGETADTLAALRYARSQGQATLALVNVPESSIAREADGVLHTAAGPEISVASTKAFTTQLAVLVCLTIAAARARGRMGLARELAMTRALLTIPTLAAGVLQLEPRVQALAGELKQATDVLYMGRGPSYAIALEGALKLKEISYIHAEGFAAGELKHGPIALVSAQTPVIVVAPSDELFERTLSNLEEVVSRGARVLLLSDQSGLERAGHLASWSLSVPTTEPMLAPILYAILVQLLAYHVAALRNADIDQPRNLAKSVTVE